MPCAPDPTGEAPNALGTNLPRHTWLHLWVLPQSPFLYGPSSLVRYGWSGMLKTEWSSMPRWSRLKWPQSVQWATTSTVLLSIIDALPWGWWADLLACIDRAILGILAGLHGLQAFCIGQTAWLTHLLGVGNALRHLMAKCVLCTAGECATHSNLVTPIYV